MTAETDVKPEAKTKADDTIATMTRAELKDLIREVMLETIGELEQYVTDPDEGLALKPEIAERLQKPRAEKGPLHSLDAVMQELGLDE